MTYYPIKIPVKAWQYLNYGDGLDIQSFQDWINTELPQYTNKIKCKEIRQNSILSITFPIKDTNFDFDMVAVFPGEWIVYIPTLEGLENFPKSKTFQKLTDKTFRALFIQEVE